MTIKVQQFTIETVTEFTNTVVGENGVRLSGGQRQRIGIARALYKESKVIVFDEATSALDEKTEDSIIETINKISKSTTVLIVSHKLSTLKYCHALIKIQSGIVKKETLLKN